MTTPAGQDEPRSRTYFARKIHKVWTDLDLPRRVTSMKRCNEMAETAGAICADEVAAAFERGRQTGWADAANEVHIEARWQTEQLMCGLPEWRRSIGRSVDRLVMLERILLARAGGAQQ